MTPESSSSGTSKNLYLVDGSGFIFRAYHALPQLTREDGTPVGAVLGFCNMLFKLLLDVKADYLAVLFDTKSKNFRHAIYPDYKSHRPPPPEDLIPQFSLIHEACEAFNVPEIRLEGFEADDLIATYATQGMAQGLNTTIVSSDKDLMQLVSPSVTMMDPLKNKRMGPQDVLEKFGVPPHLVTDVQALAGDSTDNVPGVPGIGVKTAAQLIETYGNLEGVLQNAPQIKQQKRREKLISHTEDARISYQLVLLDRAVPVPQEIETFERRGPHPKKLRSFLQEQSFKTLLERIEKRGWIQADIYESSISAKEPSSGITPASDAVNAEMVPPQTTDYALIQDETNLQRWINNIQEQGYVSIDTETTSLNPLKAKLVGISLALSPGKACYIPLSHQTEQVQIPIERVLNLLKPIFEDQGILKIGQNLKYDLLVLRSYGIRVSPIDDTMVMSYILNGTRHGHGLDTLCDRYLGHKTIKYEDVVGPKDQTFDHVPLEAACTYAAEDADMALRLHQLFKKRLWSEKGHRIYENVDRPLITVLADMEYHGVTICPDVLKRLSENFAQRLETLEQEIYTIATQPFNVGSPKQVGEILFEVLSLPGGKKGKTGAYGTSSTVLEDLVVAGHLLPEKILAWRALSKLKNTYTDTLTNQINPQTGRVNTSYGMTHTSTGRLSSSHPNLQNIPIRTTEGRSIREAFVAAPGHSFVSFDYSQAELRLLAHIADIPDLKQAFKEQADIHTLTASQVFGVSPEHVTSDLRSRAKAVNFGIIYGMSAFGLSRQLKIPRSEAQNYINSYFKAYPGIKAYMERMKLQGHEQGYVETLFGRKCFLIPAAGGALDRGATERQAINAPLQGTQADLIKKAMIQAPEALLHNGLKGKMILQIHDELIFEVPDDEIKDTISVIKPVMEKVIQLTVPMTVNPSAGKNWAEI